MPDRTIDEQLDPVDLDALQRAMNICNADPLRAMQLRAMLEDRPWSAVAEFAACSCQRAALHLKPWQVPPCVCETEPLKPQDRAARVLLKKMRDAGISDFEPDPVTALDRKGKRKRR